MRSLSSGRPEQVRVLEFVGPGETRLAFRDVPHRGPLLHTEAVGLCGTDRRIYEGALSVSAPRILGHEIVGRLDLEHSTEELIVTPLGGADPATDRVILAPAVVCGSCSGCSREAHCESRMHYGLDMPSDHLNGGMSPVLSLVRGSRLFVVSRRISLSRLVFVEAMACVVSALRAASFPDMSLAGTAAVLGFGPLGVCAATALKAANLTPVVLEPEEDRRRLAAALGFQVAPCGEAVAPASMGIVCECAGHPRAFAEGLSLLAQGGVLVEIGSYGGSELVPVSPGEICDRNLRIVGSGETRYSDFERAVEIVATTSIDLAGAVTTVLAFDDIEAGVDLFVSSPGKTMVLFE